MDADRLVADPDVVLDAVGQVEPARHRDRVPGLRGAAQEDLIRPRCEHALPLGELGRRVVRERPVTGAVRVDVPVADLHVQEVGEPEEPVDELAHRPVVEAVRGVRLDDRPPVHDEHPVGERHGLRLVVRHEDDGEVELPLQLLDLEAHRLPQLGIQVRERFVQEHHPGVGHDGPGQRDSLLLPAAQIRGKDGLKARQVGVLERLRDRLRHIASGPALDAQRERHVLEDVQVWPYGERLEHHTEPAVLRRQVEVAVPHGDRSVAEPDLARGQVLEAGDHPQRGGLAAPRRAEEGEALPFLDGQVHVADGQHALA